MGDYESVCYKKGCHGRVCLARAIYERALKTHEIFYCSAGHSQCFIGESNQERTIRELRQEVDRLRRSVEWLNEDRHELKAERWQCRWVGCEFGLAQSEAGLKTHMRAAHGMPSLALVRVAESA